MRINILAIIFILFSMFFSCQKNETLLNVNEGIEGEWIWTKWEGTIAGLTVENIDDNQNLKLIIVDNLYKEFHMDSLVFESKFILDLDKEKITFNSGSVKGIVLHETKLVISDLHPDGITTEYKRKM